NDSGVNQTAIALLLCPSSPAEGFALNKRGITDYAAACGYNRFLLPNPFLDPTPAVDPTFVGVLGRNMSRNIRDITDGTSHTVMVAEDAARTQNWQMGKVLGLAQVGGPTPEGHAAWADPLTRLLVAGFNPATNTRPGPCAVNCTNTGEVYGFHN